MGNQEVEDFGLKLSLGQGPGARARAQEHFGESLSQLSPSPLAHSFSLLIVVPISLPSCTAPTFLAGLVIPRQPQASAPTEPMGAQRSTGAAAPAPTAELVPTAPAWGKAAQSQGKPSAEAEHCGSSI